MTHQSKHAITGAEARALNVVGARASFGGP